MKKTTLIFLVIALLSAGHIDAQEKLAVIDSLVTKLHLDEGFDGNILIADRGRIIFEKSVGYANAEGKIPLTENSIFWAGIDQQGLYCRCRHETGGAGKTKDDGQYPAIFL